MTTPAVRFEHITKRFPGVQALSDVSLSIAAGSCHALCGENGAGKSTLGKILAGVYTPDDGALVIGDREVRFDGPRDALAAGVGMVHQELAFCDNLSVAENLCLGALPSRAGFVDRRERDRHATAMLAEIGAEIDVTRRLGELPIAQQQVVQIAVAVGGGARIIVFDEPTSSLSQVEAERLYALIDRLKARGVTCIYVSHRMPEVYRLCDTISVLRDGRHVATRAAAELPERELVQLMIGRPLSEYLPQHHDAGGRDELLRVEHLSQGERFQDVSFSTQGRGDRGPRGPGRRGPVRRRERAVRHRAGDERPHLRSRSRGAHRDTARRDPPRAWPGSRGSQAAGPRAIGKWTPEHVASGARPSVDVRVAAPIEGARARS